MMGFFKKDLSPDEKQELLEIIGQYKDSLVPLIVPLDPFNRYQRGTIMRVTASDTWSSTLIR